MIYLFILSALALIGADVLYYMKVVKPVAQEQKDKNWTEFLIL